MRHQVEKDFYSVLGVKKEATIDEIREAYLARIKIVHPDRFDIQNQPGEWRLANEMLADLNLAYSILRNPQTRKDYDNRSAKDHPSRESSPSSSHNNKGDDEGSDVPLDNIGELTEGQIVYKSLPKEVQERLLRRQQNKDIEQFQIKTQSIYWNYIFSLASLSWFVYLFVQSGQVNWNNETMVWYLAGTLTIGLFTGFNVTKLIRWHRSNLKPFFYVTPLYFIKTEFDIISFYPLWKLKDSSITHHYRNGVYQYSIVVLDLGSVTERISLGSTNQVNTLLDKISEYQTMAQKEYERHGYHYFRRQDDFLNVPRSSSLPLNTVFSRLGRVMAYLLSAMISGWLFIIAFYINQRTNEKTATLKQGSIPSKLPKTSSTPDPFSTLLTLQQQPLPASGTVQIFTKRERIAPFQVEASSGTHYLVKLVEHLTGQPILTVFIQSGSTEKIYVPLGTYEVRYASGTDWFGYENHFGPNTIYSKADETFTFQIKGEQISGFTITLYQVPNGNLHTSSISAEDF